MEEYVFSREPRLYKRVCPSIGQSVGPSVRPLVGNANFRRAVTRRVYELVYVNFEKNKACTGSPTNQRPSRITLTNQRPERERASQKNMRSALGARPTQIESMYNY